MLAALAGGAVAVIPARPVTDTIKRVDAGRVVAETLDRSTLRAVQTPQGFDRAVLVATPDLEPALAEVVAASLTRAGRSPLVVVNHVYGELGAWDGRSVLAIELRSLPIRWPS